MWAWITGAAATAGEWIAAGVTAFLGISVGWLFLILALIVGLAVCAYVFW